MKNILRKKPVGREQLHGRARYSIDFISMKDIKGKNILEIGFGPGSVLKHLLESDAKELLGVDISRENAKIVHEYFKGAKNVHIAEGDFLTMQLEENNFDTIIAYQVLEHLPKGAEDTFFEKVKKVGKDDCVLYLATPFRSVPGVVTDPAYFLSSHRHYNEEDFEDFASKHKFNTVMAHRGGRVWSVLGIIDLYVSKWVFRSDPLLGFLFDKLRDGEYPDPKGFTDIFIKLKANGGVNG